MELRVFVFSGGFHKVDVCRMFQRVELLKKHIRDDQKQLVALNVLHQLVVSMQRSDCECLIYLPGQSQRCSFKLLTPGQFTNQYCIYFNDLTVFLADL